MSKGSERINQLDEKLGQETVSLGGGAVDMAGGRTMTTEKHQCVCCGQLKAKAGFLYCFSCHKKWLAVYEDYRGAGFSDEIAKKRATKAYAPRYNPDQNNPERA